MKGYKTVINWDDSTLTSCIVHYRERITYEEGMFVWPKDGRGPLAVFDNYKDAKRFAGYAFQVWECDYRPSKRNSLYYTNMLGVLVELKDHLTPLGTVFADAVKLIRRC